MAGTPLRVIELLKAEIPENISLNQFCKKTGINPNSVDKYLAGMTEPTQASLQKLADYFKTSVAYLRGEPWATRDGKFDHEVIESSDERAVLRKEILDLISDLDPPDLEKVKLLVMKFKNPEM